MKMTTRVVQFVLIGSGVLALVLGLIVWTGYGDRLLGVHGLLGITFVVSLWIVALLAALSRVSIGLVALTVAWGLLVFILGGQQEELLVGSWHWTIQVLHLVISAGAILWSMRMVFLARRNVAAPASSPGAGALR